MKRVSLIAAGVLAFGLGAARADADVGAPTTTTNGSDISETPPPPPKTDVSGNPLPPGDPGVGVNPPAPQPPPPVAGVPGTVETAPAGSATMPSGADVNVNPPAPPPPPARRPVTPGVIPPARVIDANTAAISGSVTTQDVPVPPLRPVTGEFADHGTVHDTDHASWVGRMGGGLLLGGGYEDFTNSNLRSMTGGGGTWNARGVAGTRQFVGVEGAYVGSAHGIDALGVNSSAVLVSNGLEGDLRIQYPIVLRHAQLLEPFGFVGMGWARYSVTNTSVNTSDLAHSDDVLTVPGGAGVAYAIGRFMADTRFTYRGTYYNDLMRTGGSLSNWGVTGQVGFAF